MKRFGLLILCFSAVFFLLGLWGGRVVAQTAVSPTPTRDRLAPPPTVENPTLADEGAQLYWLYCQPCHGDQGQGLTDEWRAQYPPEDQNCWESGCHGERPYEDGFTIPTRVPAVIGPDSLTRFADMGQVYDFMRAAMPFQAPGSLADEEYLAITAFLARAHQLETADPFTVAAIRTLYLRETPTPIPTPTPLPTLAPTPTPVPNLLSGNDIDINLLTGVGLVIIGMLAGLWWLVVRRKRR
ncbi:MAG: hypothetical protein D6706_07815 [Chloroflexi bacterium]|nr:MAG: hypothetical protein D6706_07815 [Chloroflexota bacterium]